MTCAKRTVYCAIYLPDGFVVSASNACDNPQEVCPRAPGEGYEKCASVCRQQGHAEEQALQRARRLNLDLKGARAYISGHDYACQSCCEQLKAAGLRSVTIIFDVETDRLATARTSSTPSSRKPASCKGPAIRGTRSRTCTGSTARRATT